MVFNFATLIKSLDNQKKPDTIQTIPKGKSKKKGG